MIAIESAADFHAAVAKTEQPVVAFFSTPWCGSCKMVTPKVEALAEELQPRAQFVQVSAEKLETLCEEVEVDSFPHFRVYVEGKVLGDCTSSKFDKVDAFIRTLVAPDTMTLQEETPEGDDAMEEAAAAEETSEKDEAGEKETAEKVEAGGSPKKRPERDESESNDEPIAKKAKTEEPKEEEADGATNDKAVVVKKVVTEVVTVVETVKTVVAPTEKTGSGAVEQRDGHGKTEAGEQEQTETVDAEKSASAEAVEAAVEHADTEEMPVDDDDTKKEAAPLQDKLEVSEAVEVNVAITDAPAA